MCFLFARTCCVAQSRDGLERHDTDDDQFYDNASENVVDNSDALKNTLFLQYARRLMSVSPGNYFVVVVHSLRMIFILKDSQIKTKTFHIFLYTATRHDERVVDTVFDVLLADAAPSRSTLVLVSTTTTTTTTIAFRRGAYRAQWRHARALLALLRVAKLF